MTDKNFNSIEQLMEYVYRQIKQTMELVMADFIEQKLRESIETRVFEPYTPLLYERRSLNSDNEGLLNCWNRQIDEEGNTIRLIIENTASKVWSNSGYSLAELIEYGEEPKDKPWLVSRKFIEPVIQELQSSKQIEKILKESLDFLV